jgi:hypothetical protein
MLPVKLLTFQKFLLSEIILLVGDYINFGWLRFHQLNFLLDPCFFWNVVLYSSSSSNFVFCKPEIDWARKQD